MAVCNSLNGKYVTLACADTDDAGFTLDIRNDPELTRFIPRISGDIHGQEAWIKAQRDKPFDVFFIIRRTDGDAIGTISCYDYDEKNQSCDVGRYISYGNAYENIEAALLTLDYAFDMKNLSFVTLGMHVENSPVISLWGRFGAVFNERKDMDGWQEVQYMLRREGYYEKREMIKRVLRYPNV